MVIFLKAASVGPIYEVEGESQISHSLGLERVDAVSVSTEKAVAAGAHQPAHAFAARIFAGAALVIVVNDGWRILAERILAFVILFGNHGVVSPLGHAVLDGCGVTWAVLGFFPAALLASPQSVGRRAELADWQGFPVGYADPESFCGFAFFTPLAKLFLGSYSIEFGFWLDDLADDALARVFFVDRHSGVSVSLAQSFLLAVSLG